MPIAPLAPATKTRIVFSFGTAHQWDVAGQMYDPTGARNVTGGQRLALLALLELSPRRRLDVTIFDD
jgi:hypothetical protein